MAWKIEGKPDTEVYLTVRGKIAIKQLGVYGLSEDQLVIIGVEDIDRVTGWMQEAKAEILADPEAFESGDEEESKGESEADSAPSVQ